MSPSADTQLPGNGGVSGAVYSLNAFGARLPGPFDMCAYAGFQLARLSGASLLYLLVLFKGIMAI